MSWLGTLWFEAVIEKIIIVAPELNVKYRFDINLAT